MPTYRYDLPAMSEFVELLDKSIGEITAHCDEMKTAVTALREHYSGTAADAFTSFHDNWQATAAEQVQSLRAYREFVSTANDNYAEAQRKNAEMFGWSR